MNNVILYDIINFSGNGAVGPCKQEVKKSSQSSATCGTIDQTIQGP